MDRARERLSVGKKKISLFIHFDFSTYQLQLPGGFFFFYIVPIPGPDPKLNQFVENLSPPFFSVGFESGYKIKRSFCTCRFIYFVEVKCNIMSLDTFVNGAT